MTPMQRRAWERLDGVKWHVCSDPIEAAYALALECERRALSEKRWRRLAKSYRILLSIYRPKVTHAREEAE